MNMDKQRHIEAIEASRPQGSDLAEHFPETEAAIRSDGDLQAFAAHVRDVDTRISGVMQDVVIPDGLFERLQKNALDSQTPVSRAGGGAGPGSSSRSLRKMTSRQWLTLAGGIVAACVAIAAFFAMPRSSESEMKSLIAAFEDMEALRASRKNWQRPLADFRLPAEINRPARLVQRIKSKEYGNAVLVDLAPNATLLVVNGQVNSLLNPPLTHTGGNTGSFRYTAWSANGKTYLLAVENGELEDFLIASPSFIS
ncbi:MAG: hypothetical protein KDB27_27140 [Planctomycetales bacterium]|nr:hypothetical protein [Planctomycetales bacterium]